jgi:anti-sigma factor RsiW
MQCERARELLSPYLDAELPPDEQRSAAAHVAGCEGCARLAADYRRVGRIVAEGAREPLPASLVPRVRSALAQAGLAGSDGTRLPPARLGIGWMSSRPRLGQAAALAAACLLTALATWWVVSASAGRGRLAQEIVAAHIRSLLQERQIDVASSDIHTVKPWFAGRIDFSPEVRTGEGLALQGGRVDYIDGRRVAVLFYKRRQHTISVFLWPSPSGDAAPPRAMTQKGYNLLTWSRNGLTRWAITDLNAEELRQLQELM